MVLKLPSYLDAVTLPLCFLVTTLQPNTGEGTMACALALCCSLFLGGYGVNPSSQLGIAPPAAAQPFGFEYLDTHTHYTITTSQYKT